LNTLKIRGAAENNLKNLDIDLPHDKFITISGLSGSGKSTLAFDTIYAEGGRRYIETFSPYTRQYLDRLEEPKMVSMEGVRPALALEQRNRVSNSRSTVGTVTDINEFLKLLFSRISIPYCTNCNSDVKGYRPEQILNEILETIDKSETIYLGFKLNISPKAEIGEILKVIESEGYLRFYSLQSERILRGEEYLINDGRELIVIVQRFRGEYAQLLSAINHALTVGRGEVYLIEELKGKFSFKNYTESVVCPTCKEVFPPAKPYFFSFNSPLGACSSCNGFGQVLSVAEELVIDEEKSIKNGAVSCWGKTSPEYKKLLQFCEKGEIPITLAWSEMKAAHRKLIFSGGTLNSLKFKGVEEWFTALLKKRHKLHVRVFLARYRREFPCHACHGSRLQPLGSKYRVWGDDIQKFWSQPIEKLKLKFENHHNKNEKDDSVKIPFQEILTRLKYLEEIGVGYLTLNRVTKSLSGGEFQRVNLTSILGASLTNSTIVLDEPTIGLHPSDTERLIRSARLLRDRGNTVIVVEHDREMIRASDIVVDIGPNAGKEGGEIVYNGEPSGLKHGHTAEYLNRKHIPKYRTTLSGFKSFIKIKKAHAHNLKNVTVQFPHNAISVVTGISGSGKSSLIQECLATGRDCELTGTDGFEIVAVDQQPVGRTPRANIGTYSGIWDIVREQLALTAESIQLGFSKSTFSFNVDGGRCPFCSGAGYNRIEMQFLPDVFVTCDVCNGERFQDAVLGVKLYGLTVSELLGVTVDDLAVYVEKNFDESVKKKVLNLTAPLIKFGLGYLRVGHSLNQLSGGEAQRLKLATYLQEGAKNKLFLLDEPTTGLHPKNVRDLIEGLDQIVKEGNSIIVIEHNLDLIYNSDWIVDLGPGGGEYGGELIVAGELENVLAKKENQKSLTISALLGEVGKIPIKVPNVPAYFELPPDRISVVKAKEHNLKDVSLEIPHQKITVITGVSGSGKSTLAFDIIYSEGQRRFIDSLSPYARQFIKQLKRAEVERVVGIPPTVAVSQKTAPPIGISTVATTTELYQFLRLLYSKIGLQLCPDHQLPISTFSSEQILQEFIEKYHGKRIWLRAPVIQGRKGNYTELFRRALKSGLDTAYIDGKYVEIYDELRLERNKIHWISLVVATLKVDKGNPSLLLEGINQALALSGGTLELVCDDRYNAPTIYSTDRICPKCHRGFRPLDPQDFSFRSNRGVCEKCRGYGQVENKKGISVKCNECGGARISQIGRDVIFNERRIFELTAMRAAELRSFFANANYSRREKTIAQPILKEINHRLDIIESVGLEYLSLDRDSHTLSGGESQRLRLARTLGAPLSGVCYIFDEPSIGLHSQDHASLLRTLEEVRDQGNTVIVVEHDEDTIRAADYILDFGPVGGSKGGQLLAEGTVDEIEANPNSVTGKALLARTNGEFLAVNGRSLKKSEFLELKDCSDNNLKAINVKFPIGALTTVVGVSGAGKSSLVFGSLKTKILADLAKKSKRELMQQQDGVTKLLEIDQSSIGRTPASIPASFLGILTEIRDLFSGVPEAKARGWNSGYFSFNSGKGKCQNCEGKGVVKVPMSFMPDALTECEVCRGMRYRDETLEITYLGRSIGEILNMSLEEVKDLLHAHKKIVRPLEWACELGLGYLGIGQPSYTLSGGEAQRLKIARELGTKGAKSNLYLLDEPTTGLHMNDVDKLVKVIQGLCERGNTVVVIEHNLDLIRQSDWLIEVGPVAGDNGGKLLYQGEPKGLLKKSTPTADALNGTINQKPEKFQQPKSIGENYGQNSVL